MPDDYCIENDMARQKELEHIARDTRIERALAELRPAKYFRTDHFADGRNLAVRRAINILEEKCHE